MTTTRAPSTEPLPVGFGLRMDDSAREVEPGVWFGGQPARVLRITAAGQSAWQELQEGPVQTPAGGRLARRLTDAGLAHPIPPAAPPTELTVIVPVYDRADELDRCLTALGSQHPVVVVDDGSNDPTAVRAVADRHGARLIRLPANLGPAAARNAGVVATDTELVAFLDSDTIPAGDWITPLAAHLSDPLVAAAAPRIQPRASSGWVGLFTARRSPLDLGGAPAPARLYGRVAYVPTAALLARRTALTAVAGADGPFDESLRVGEDVDLVWRLVAAGWRIRYDPDATVAHSEPTQWRALLSRRFRYGTSTALLAQRHPGNVAPFIVHRWYTAAVLAALAGRPVPAAAAALGAYLTTRRRVRRYGLPTTGLPQATAQGFIQTWLGLGRCATQYAGPALLAGIAAGTVRSRVAAASLLVGPALSGWRASDRHLDPARFLLASVADDAAYGAGVLTGCVKTRTARPLRPLLVTSEIST